MVCREPPFFTRTQLKMRAHLELLFKNYWLVEENMCFASHLTFHAFVIILILGLCVELQYNKQQLLQLINRCRCTYIFPQFQIDFYFNQSKPFQKKCFIFECNSFSGSFINFHCHHSKTNNYQSICKRHRRVRLFNDLLLSALKWFL